jgi:hypothetical protein
MRHIQPKEYFDIKVTKGLNSVEYFEHTIEGKRRINGRLAIRLKLKDPKFDDNDISNLLSPLAKIENNIYSFLKQRTNRLHHKLCGIKYHMNNFIVEEESRVREFNTSYQAENVEYIFDNNKLIYETEAFLFQIKSSLDVLSALAS